MKKIIYLISFLVLVLVIFLNNLPQSKTIPNFVKILPKFNAILNFICFILLIISLISIKKRKIYTHKLINIITFILSTIFILSYVAFHSFGIKTHFPIDNPLRYIYLTILISHIILAAIVLPLILFSFHKAFIGDFKNHKRITKWSMPIWIYVTFSGVIVYIMISPYYNF